MPCHMHVPWFWFAIILQPFPLLFPQAADLDGEIDLSTCYDVTEYPVQRNYGFQIHVRTIQRGELVEAGGGAGVAGTF